MASRDPEDKRRRLIEAGLAEFAAHGIAGARIDRIAKAAGCSAGLVYTYFGGKEDLFDAVVKTMVERVIEDDPLTPDDLPEYAGRMFDGYEDNPQVTRFLTWHRLEGERIADIPLVAQSNARKVALIADAQRRGVIPDRYPPAELLGLIMQLAAVWTGATPRFVALGEFSRAQRRALVTDSVAALLRD